MLLICKHIAANHATFTSNQLDYAHYLLCRYIIFYKRVGLWMLRVVASEPVTPNGAKRQKADEKQDLYVAYIKSYVLVPLACPAKP